MSFDLEVLETLNGGDIIKNDTDIEVITGFQNVVYLALFGGNPGQSTPDTREVNEQNFDFWANSLLLDEKKAAQYNSLTENRLRNIALTSSGVDLLTQDIEKDLEHVKEFANVDVQVSILSETTLEIKVGLQQPDNEQNKEFVFIWDATEKELPSSIKRDAFEVFAPTDLLAVQNGSDIDLTWNGSGTLFLIQRSSDNIIFNQIGASPINSFSDNSPITGKSFYKVKVISPGISDFSNTASVFFLNFQSFGATEWEFRPESQFMTFNTNPPAPRISQWDDNSGNGFDVSQATEDDQPGLTTKPFGSTVILPEPLVGRGTDAGSVDALMAFTAKSTANFLHQGTDDYTLLFEIFLNPNNFGVGVSLAFPATGTFQSTGLDLFLRNNFPTAGDDAFLRVNLWNGATQILNMTTPNDGFVEDEVNLVMVTFNATTREFKAYVNASTVEVDTVTDNFSSGDSDSFYGPVMVGEPTNGQAILPSGFNVAWKGTILDQTDYNEIRTALRERYGYS